MNTLSLANEKRGRRVLGRISSLINFTVKGKTVYKNNPELKIEGVNVQTKKMEIVIQMMKNIDYEKLSDKEKNELNKKGRRNIIIFIIFCIIFMIAIITIIVMGGGVEEGQKIIEIEFKLSNFKPENIYINGRKINEEEKKIFLKILKRNNQEGSMYIFGNESEEDKEKSEILFEKNNERLSFELYVDFKCVDENYCEYDILKISINNKLELVSIPRERRVFDILRKYNK